MPVIFKSQKQLASELGDNGNQKVSHLSDLSKSPKTLNSQLPKGLQRDASRKSQINVRSSQEKAVLASQEIPKRKKPEDLADDELKSAVEQIRKRHESEMQLETVQQQINDQPQVLKQTNEATSTTEFLLLVIQQSFSFKTKQVQDILTNQNPFLMNACNRGIQGSFQKVLTWLEMLVSKQNFAKMIELFVEAFEKGQFVEVSLVLSSVKSALLSQNERVARLAIQFFTQVSDETYEMANKSYHQQVVSWYVKVVKQTLGNDKTHASSPPTPQTVYSSVFRSSVELLENHPFLVREVAILVTSLFREPSLRLVKMPELLYNVFQDDIFMCYETMNTLLPELNKLDREASRLMLEGSDIIQQALKDAVENEQDYALKLKCTNLLFEIWYLYPTLVSQTSWEIKGLNGMTIKDSFQLVLKQSTCERDKVFRINAFANAFCLLDRLAQKKNKEAAAVYKTLIIALIEHYKNKQTDEQVDQTTTDMALKNFIDIFNTHETIPKHVMLNPFIDQMLQNMQTFHQSWRVTTTTEIEFLKQVFQNHGSTLDENTTQAMLEFFVHVYMNHPYVGHVMGLGEQIANIVASNKEVSVEICSYVQTTLVSQLLAQMISLKKQQQVSMNQRNLLSNPRIKGHSPKPGSKGRKLLEKKEKETDADFKVKRFNIISLLEKLHTALDQTNTQDALVTLVQESDSQYFALFRQQNQGLLHLLNKFGAKSSPQSKLIPAVVLKSDQSEDPSSNRQLVLSQERESEIDSLMRQNKKKEPNWEAIKQPKGPIAQRAFEELQQIKAKRLEKINKAKNEEAKKKQKQDRLNSEALQEVNMRAAIMGMESQNRQQKMRAMLAGQNPDDVNFLSNQPEIKPVLENEAQQNAIVPYKSIPVIAKKKEQDTLVDLMKEEDRERDAVRLVVERYTQLFKYLFDKYTSNRKRLSSDIVSERTIRVTELIKLLRDHNIDHSMLTKHEVQTITMRINNKLLLKYGNEALTFNGFVQFLMQSAFFMHDKERFKAPVETGGREIKYLSFGDMLQNMITWFSMAAKSRGYTVLFYENPDSLLDPARAQQLSDLNRQIKQNQKIPLPTGFFLSSEQTQVQDYGLPDEAKPLLGGAKVAALEILDALLFEKVGVHFLEPKVKLTEGPVVKLSLQKQIDGLSELSTPSQARALTGSDLTKQRSKTQMKNSIIAKTSGIRAKKGSHASVQSQPVPKAQLESINRRLQLDVGNPSEAYGYHSEMVDQSAYKSLDIYSQANLLKAKSSQKSTLQTRANSVHRASGISPIKASAPKLNQSREYSVYQTANKAKMQRENESLLMQMDLTPDLKVACYELQMHELEEERFDDIRQCSRVLEDMLQVVCGSKNEYPFYKKPRAIKPLTKSTQRSISSRSSQPIISVHQLRKEQLKSITDIRREEQKKKDMEEEEVKQKLKEFQRVQRSLVTKQNLLAARDSQSQERLDPYNIGAKSINIELGKISQKEIQKMRAKQLKISLEEREQRKQLRQQDKLEAEMREKQEKSKLAQQSKKRIDSYRKELQHLADEKQTIQIVKQNSGTVQMKREQPKFQKVKNQSLERLTKGAQSSNKQASIKQELDKQSHYIAKERKEVLAFYLRPDVQKIMDAYEDILGEFFDKLVDAKTLDDREIQRLKLRAYSYQFGLTAKLIPDVLQEQDLELIFDTAVNERVDGAMAEMQSQALDIETFGVTKSSLSFEEFKKSLVRIASICAVSTRYYNSDMQPVNEEEEGQQDQENDWKNASEISGGYVMGHGPKTEVIKLIKKPNKAKKSKKQEMFDVSKLKPETFQKVLKFICDNIKDQEPPAIPLRDINLTERNQSLGSQTKRTEEIGSKIGTQNTGRNEISGQAHPLSSNREGMGSDQFDDYNQILMSPDAQRTKVEPTIIDNQENK